MTTIRPLTQTQQRMSRIAQVLVFDTCALTGIALLLRLESPSLIQSILYPLLGGCLGFLGACVAKVSFDAAQDHLVGTDEQ
jgi:Na+/proline symporter